MSLANRGGGITFRVLAKARLRGGSRRTDFLEEQEENRNLNSYRVGLGNTVEKS